MGFNKYLETELNESSAKDIGNKFKTDVDAARKMVDDTYPDAKNLKKITSSTLKNMVKDYNKNLQSYKSNKDFKKIFDLSHNPIGKGEILFAYLCGVKLGGSGVDIQTGKEEAEMKTGCSYGSYEYKTHLRYHISKSRYNSKPFISDLKKLSYALMAQGAPFKSTAIREMNGSFATMNNPHLEVLRTTTLLNAPKEVELKIYENGDVKIKNSGVYSPVIGNISDKKLIPDLFVKHGNIKSFNNIQSDFIDMIDNMYYILFDDDLNAFYVKPNQSNTKIAMFSGYGLDPMTKVR